MNECFVACKSVIELVCKVIVWSECMESRCVFLLCENVGHFSLFVLAIWKQRKITALLKQTHISHVLPQPPNILCHKSRTRAKLPLLLLHFIKSISFLNVTCEHSASHFAFDERNNVTMSDIRMSFITSVPPSHISIYLNDLHRPLFEIKYVLHVLAWLLPHASQRFQSFTLWLSAVCVFGWGDEFLRGGPPAAAETVQ